GINISTGILRARYRDGYDREVPLRPNEPTLFTITMLPIGIRFLAGSRIRLDVTSSDFPAFDRNHNSGGEDWRDSKLLLAHQTVFHGASHPSRVVMPLIE
ncbi:MAG: hypothetical protein KC438_14550, partial [Thermomicrobiales bacterium]|nr:hypothetical protein [Thermomicrobiales bacterium]